MKNLTTSVAVFLLVASGSLYAQTSSGSDQTKSKQSTAQSSGSQVVVHNRRELPALRAASSLVPQRSLRDQLATTIPLIVVLQANPKKIAK